MDGTSPAAHPARPPAAAVEGEQPGPGQRDPVEAGEAAVEDHASAPGIPYTVERDGEGGREKGVVHCVLLKWHGGRVDHAARR